VDLVQNVRFSKINNYMLMFIVVCLSYLEGVTNVPLSEINAELELNNSLWLLT